MKIYNNISELIGGTPLIKLNSIGADLDVELIAKVESFNPSSSVKDRIALNMLETAKDEGLVNKETTIIEPTSGNTGVGLAMLCAQMGSELILTMPDSMSVERRNLFALYGAKLVLTPASEGMNGAIKKAKELSSEIKNSFIPSQFDNPSNPIAHKNGTAVEILADTDSNIDIFIAGVGTGGTFSGVASVLKEKIPNLKAYAVEPTNSAVLSGESGGPHKIQGIGAGFIPVNMDTSLIDEVIKIENEVAYEYALKLAREEGLSSGISSGAVVAAAIKVAKRPENRGKRIVFVLPDSGERYLSVLL